MIKYLFIIALLINTIELPAQDEYVIMVSLDGFRWDYCAKNNTPVFDSLAAYGIKAESLEASFPTKTFPNHYTLVTGLYPDHHGIVNNSFYCPEFKVIYEIADRSMVEDGNYYGGKPIWNLAEEQGIKSASFFWVGSEAAINNERPGYWKKYIHKFPFEQRIDTVVSWLKLPENERPHLILLYFHEPDSKGHKYGPDSKEIKELIPKLDSLIGHLFYKINQLDIKNKVNVIVTSDHGMSSISKEKVVILKDYIKEDWFDHLVGSNPVFNVWAKNGFADSIYLALKGVKHISCWKNSEIPKRLNYGNNPRTGDFTILAESTWSVEYDKVHTSGSKGAHGFDNENKDMNGIFYAIGPAFKSGYKTASIKNIDIYPLIAHILGLQIPKIDGKLDRIKDVLIHNP